MSSDLLASPVIDTVSCAGDNARENHRPDDLITFLCGSLAILWKDWPKQMELTELQPEKGSFSLRGKCPHCQERSVFTQVTSVCVEEVGVYRDKLAVGMQCQGCLDYILSLAMKISGPNQQSKLSYLDHYPLGRPNDSVDPDVPKDIAADFAEALRCQWVGSYKAAVAMCRRSVEAACHDLGATGKNLYQKIDDLASRGVITDPLKRMAHRIRLTGNENLHGKADAAGAHFDDDDLKIMREKDAIAMITFTKEFFHHVYAIRALLEQYENPQGETAEEG